ncbi:hypothetical protein KQI89_05520 [Clostridium sp. MSJ-4]|uniref:Uncharacterized protein n=1 Tax=Clostridium simiarum TaxID=2841506 RepID=A0ABS6F0W1_9CLOT|nr:hypothetical protein [Clostridium simiarum]MBU5591217.1 hypothetical protein [Clostridium simiarum]
MKRKIQMLVSLNITGYLYMIFLVFQIDNGKFNYYTNVYKFILGNIPYIFIVLTSFILANDRFTELKKVMLASYIDWIFRIVAFQSAIYYSDKYKNIQLSVIILSLFFIINVLTELFIMKKLDRDKDKVSFSEKEEISYEDKCNLKHMVKAVNLGMIQYILFCALGLLVPINANMEGATLWFIPVLLSIFIFLNFVNKMKEIYKGYCIYKEETKKIYVRDMTTAAIAYGICLIASFIKISQSTYNYVFLLGVLIMIQPFNNLRKVSLKISKVKKNLDIETIHYFMTRDEE